jgi:hypothetical protein
MIKRSNNTLKNFVIYVKDQNVYFSVKVIVKELFILNVRRGLIMVK